SKEDEGRALQETGARAPSFLMLLSSELHHHRVFFVHDAAVDGLHSIQMSVRCQHEEHDTNDRENI
ncbi:hypothetical protein L195_g063631, partial [Trifolium pratense]